MADRRRAESSTVARATQVLTALIDVPDVGVSELSRRFGWPKSVTHRVLTTLVSAGFLILEPERRRYRLGPIVLRLGLAALARADLHRLALPHLRALRERTGETSTATVLSDDERVYVDQVESSHPVRQIIEAGTRAPLYLGASSKAILAYLPAARQARILEHAAHATRADGTPVDVAALTAELPTIRARGFAVSRGERIAGAASVAAPIFGHGGDVIGSISVASVTVRLSTADLEAFGPLVRSTAEALSRELGWHSREDRSGAPHPSTIQGAAESSIARGPDEFKPGADGRAGEPGPD